jgi:hypothetical protein
MLSHASDNAAKSCCRGDLAAVRSRCRVILATMLPSHAGDDAAEVTWPRRDIDAESCWQQCYQVMLVMTQPRQLGRDEM